MFGDGSDGALSVTSGTTNLQLDRKYQYTTVNVSAGATLSTSSTSGSVLYILANTSITINGVIDLRAKVSRGQNSWTVTIDGKLYKSPSTADGGYGGNVFGTTRANQNLGFGGGGSGGFGGQTPPNPGNGGTGGTIPVGGAGRTGTNGDGGVAQQSGGGGGARQLVNGTGSGANGGSTHGAAGGNASMSGQSGTQIQGVGGGGGAGGAAGHPGITLVLKSPSITINGTIYTSGTDGQDGGDGGLSVTRLGNGTIVNDRAGGGGGGGGGHSGNVEITSYKGSYSNNGTVQMLGGDSSFGGLGSVSGQFGDIGNDGELIVTLLTPPVPPDPYQGPFARIWDGTKWKYSRVKSMNTTSYKDSRLEVL